MPQYIATIIVYGTLPDHKWDGVRETGNINKVINYNFDAKNDAEAIFLANGERRSLYINTFESDPEICRKNRSAIEKLVRVDYIEIPLIPNV